MVRGLGTYDKRTFEIKVLEQKVLKLEEQIDQMKNCENCNSKSTPCVNCFDYDGWTMVVKKET